MAEVNVKKVRERCVRINDAWEQGAASVKFGGKDQSAFQAELNAAVATEGELADILRQADIKRTEIAEKYTALNNNSVLVVDGVKGDPAYGPDSPLYDAMGFIRKSERKSGLTKKKKTP